MPTIFPSFYSSFRCEPFLCKHSCCVDWEIGIDADALARYRTRTDALSAHICAHIEEHPDPHFVLTEEDRCPFLQSDGLCSLIALQGQEILPEICREHPRFRNFYEGNLTELSVGLSCEIAVTHLLKENALTFLYSSDEIDALTDLSAHPFFPLNILNDFAPSLEKAFLTQKYRLISHFLDEDATFLAHIHEEVFSPYLSHYRKNISSALANLPLLDMLHADFSTLFSAFSENEEARDNATFTTDTPEERAFTSKEKRNLFVHTLFRHATTESFYSFEASVSFSLFFLALAEHLVLYRNFEKVEAIRLLSSEIEYSEENTDKVLEAFE